jgi:EmrB/QacA subfamily drug resistance transporter
MPEVLELTPAVITRPDETTTPRSLRTSWPLLAALALATAAVTVDNTILNVALPSIARSLHSGESQLQWIGNAYSLLFGGLLLAAGNLSDRLGRRRVLLGGLAAFAVVSSLVVFVTGSAELIGLRALTGAAAAFVMPSTLSLIYRLFEGPARTAAMASWSMATVLGFVGGPLLGGVLLAHFSWHACFLVNVPIAVAALVATALLVPESSDRTGARADVVGAALSVGVLGALICGLVNGPVTGWGSARCLVAFAGSVGLSLTFWRWESRSTHPLLPLDLLRSDRLAGPVVIEACLMFSITGLLFLMTQQLQLVDGYSPLGAGLRTIPAAAGSLLAGAVGVRLGRRFGQHIAATAGYVTCAVGLVLAASSLTQPYWHLAIGLVVFGIGLRLAMTPVALSVVGGLPRERAGMGAALNDTVQEVGGALGVAILGSVLNAVYHSSSAGRGAVRLLGHHAANSLTAVLGAGDTRAAALAREGFLSGNRAAMLVCAGLMACAALLAVRAVPADLSAAEAIEAELA